MKIGDLIAKQGNRVMKFATSGSTMVISAHFPTRDIYKLTYTSLDGHKTNNQINHVMIKKRKA